MENRSQVSQVKEIFEGMEALNFDVGFYMEAVNEVRLTLVERLLAYLDDHACFSYPRYLEKLDRPIHFQDWACRLVEFSVPLRIVNPENLNGEFTRVVGLAESDYYDPESDSDDMSRRWTLIDQNGSEYYLTDLEINDLYLLAGRLTGNICSLHPKYVKLEVGK